MHVYLQYVRTRGIHKVSFPLIPQLLNHLLREATGVRDREMKSLDACTSGTSRVLTVVSLQRLKMEALIPPPADREVRPVIKFLNAQSIAPIEIHRQQCQVYRHTRLDGQHITCRSSAVRCLINNHPPYNPDLASVNSSFYYKSRNSCPVTVGVFRMQERLKL